MMLQHVLVVGGSRGIGFAIARKFVVRIAVVVAFSVKPVIYS